MAGLKMFHRGIDEGIENRRSACRWIEIARCHEPFAQRDHRRAVYAKFQRLSRRNRDPAAVGNDLTVGFDRLFGRRHGFDTERTGVFERRTERRGSAS